MFEHLLRCSGLFDDLPRILRDPEEAAAVQAVCAALQSTAQQIAEADYLDESARRDIAPVYRGFLAASRVIAQLHEGARMRRRTD